MLFIPTSVTERGHPYIALSQIWTNSQCLERAPNLTMMLLVVRLLDELDNSSWKRFRRSLKLTPAQPAVHSMIENTSTLYKDIIIRRSAYKNLQRIELRVTKVLEIKKTRRKQSFQHAIVEVCLGDIQHEMLVTSIWIKPYTCNLKLASKTSCTVNPAIDIARFLDSTIICLNIQDTRPQASSNCCNLFN